MLNGHTNTLSDTADWEYNPTDDFERAQDMCEIPVPEYDPEEDFIQ